MGKIHRAARDGDLATVKKLVESGDTFSGPVPIDTPHSYLLFADDDITVGDTAMLCAIKHGHLDVVRYLYSKGALLPSDGWSIALERLDIDMMKFLKNEIKLAIPISLDADSALIKAFRTSYKDISLIKFLMYDLGGQIWGEKDSYNTIFLVLHNVMAGLREEEPGKDSEFNKEYIVIIKKCLQDLIDVPKIPLFEGANVLKLDLKAREKEIYDFIIDLCMGDAKPNTPNILSLILQAYILNRNVFLDRCTAKNLSADDLLLGAAAAGKLNAVKTLIEEQGANPNVKMADGSTLIDLAKKYELNDYAKVVQYLVDAQKAKAKQAKVDQRARDPYLQNLMTITPLEQRAETFTLEAIAIMPRIYQEPAMMTRYQFLLEEALKARANFAPALLALRAIISNFAQRDRLSSQVRSSFLQQQTHDWFLKRLDLNAGINFLYGSYLELIEKNLAKAIVFYSKAAQEGVVQAKNALAIHYETGTGGFSPDEKLARKLYIEAAEGGQIVAAYNVLRCFTYGIGGDRDRDTALQWGEVALTEKNPDTYLVMAHTYLHCPDKKKMLDYPEGYKMLRLCESSCEAELKEEYSEAIDETLADAEYALARCLIYGGEHHFGSDYFERALSWAKFAVSRKACSDETQKQANALISKITQLFDQEAKAATQRPTNNYRSSNSSSGGSVPDGVKDRAARPTVYK
ncbi:MAG: hypothetical protein WC748_06625 [Legionellales bacterium]|jgi:TPR repeat protein